MSWHPRLIATHETRTPAVLRWLVLTFALAVLVDLSVTMIGGGRGSLRDIMALTSTILFALTLLSTWVGPNLPAVLLPVPLVITLVTRDSLAGLLFVPVVLGILCAVADRWALALGVILSGLWLGLFPAVFPDDAIALTLEIPLIIVVLALVEAYRRHVRRHEQDRSRLAETNQRLAEARQLVQDESLRVRQSVSRDLHDVVAHGITVIALQSDVAVYTGDKEEALRALRSISETSHQTLADLRFMLRLLREDAELPDDGGPDAEASASIVRITESVEEFRRTLAELGFTVFVDVDPRVAILSRGESVLLHRIMQEAVTNVLKHGEPHSKASLRLRIGRARPGEADDVVSPGQEFVELVLVNRLAFSPAAGVGLAEANQGMPAVRLGLVNMSERARALSGTCTAGVHGDEWVVTVRLPLVRSDDAAEEAESPTG